MIHRRKYGLSRPGSHQIADEAERFFLSQLPKEWVARDMHPDYGLDYEIEVFTSDGCSTGLLFKVQLKGTMCIAHKKKFEHFSMRTKYVQFYLQLRLPVFLVLVDVVEKVTYWLYMQRYIRYVLERENPDWETQESITLRLPANRNVPKFDDIKAAVEDVMSTRSSECVEGLIDRLDQMRPRGL